MSIYLHYCLVFLGVSIMGMLLTQFMARKKEWPGVIGFGLCTLMAILFSVSLFLIHFLKK
jgi:hypothetical protein